MKTSLFSIAGRNCVNSTAIFIFILSSELSCEDLLVSPLQGGNIESLATWRRHFHQTRPKCFFDGRLKSVDSRPCCTKFAWMRAARTIQGRLFPFTLYFMGFPPVPKFILV